MLICTVKRIFSTATSARAVHDLKLFRLSGVRFPHQTALIGDAGYQGLWRSHQHAITTHKATLASPLSAEQRQENRVLAYTRQGTLRVIRHMKIFHVLKGVYRHRRRRFALRFQLIAALCNLTQACPS
ncbi:transposase family protein [Deinococcus hopiensis]|uniref:transposase family protein n=1 Tax=Deinococcus hopiensis TaxID=309885 RepID=UPI001FE51AE3|nr:transposase family protein [Deinococcus hopiensis]